MVVMPFSSHLARSFVVIAPSRLRVVAFDCERSAPRLEITYWTMIIQDERGRFRGVTERCDCLDNLSRFLEVVGDPDALAPVRFAVNDFTTHRNFGSRRKPDGQCTEANDKIVGLITFVPSRIEDRYPVLRWRRTLRPTTASQGCQVVATEERSLTVHEQSGPVAAGVAYQLQEIDWQGIRQALWEILACPDLIRVRNASANVGEKGIWRLLAMRGQIGFCCAFQISGKGCRSDVGTRVHGFRTTPTGRDREGAAIETAFATPVPRQLHTDIPEWSINVRRTDWGRKLGLSERLIVAAGHSKARRFRAKPRLDQNVRFRLSGPKADGPNSTLACRSSRLGPVALVDPSRLPTGCPRLNRPVPEADLREFTLLAATRPGGHSVAATHVPIADIRLNAAPLRILYAMKAFLRYSLRTLLTLQFVNEQLASRPYDDKIAIDGRAQRIRIVGAGRHPRCRP